MNDNLKTNETLATYMAQRSFLVHRVIALSGSLRWQDFESSMKILKEEIARIDVAVEKIFGKTLTSYNGPG